MKIDNDITQMIYPEFLRIFVILKTHFPNILYRLLPECHRIPRDISCVLEAHRPFTIFL